MEASIAVFVMCEYKLGFIYAFSCGRRGTALAVDEELCKYKLYFTPHPSGFACHLPLLGKAWFVQ